MAARPAYPRFPEKWRFRSITSPAAFHARYRSGVVAPASCVVLWNPRVAESLARRIHAEPVAAIPRTWSVPGTRGQVGFTVPRGVGAPTTVIHLEELVAAGSRRFIGVGFAGGIAPDAVPGEVVVPDRAIRDEGTSHHYAPAHVVAEPSRPLRRWVESLLRRSGIPFRTGPNWTIDAPYRETVAELRHYRADGVLTVEMEASAMFLFARARRVPIASALVVSDRLSERGWELQFHAVGDRVGRIAGAILDTWASERPSRTAPGGTARAGSTAARRRSTPRRAARSRSTS
ncbi:MAG TPA: nucleoside phosphorylase [Thermoplasmata archaeon]|nr:nucleoside phosphorylase [Thermoplasmata archaeon]